MGSKGVFFIKVHTQVFSYAQCFFFILRAISGIVTIPAAGNRKVVWVLSLDHFQIHINTVYR